MIPRPYQQEAVDAFFSYLERAPTGSHPIIEAPTGSGKSLVLAMIARAMVQEYDARVVVATHSAELIKQNAITIRKLWPQAPVGIYSASVGRREIMPITVCGVQSMARHASRLGAVDLFIVDEAHRVNMSEGTFYRRCFDACWANNPDMRILGLTATPYRLGQGMLTEGDGSIFSSICYRIGVRMLIDKGYLSRVTTQAPGITVDTSTMAKEGGDFAKKDLALGFDVDKVNATVAADIARTGRKSAMVFCVDVKHCHRMRTELVMAGLSAEVITGETPEAERSTIITRFKAGALRCLVSCEVLTTGFDAPGVDLIAIVRATMSAALYVQIVGRGMRLADGKTDCLILDYGGNIARHGPIDDVQVKPKNKGGGDAPVKLCPKCMAMAPPAARECEHCGYLWPEPERKAKVNDKASGRAILKEPPKPRTEHVDEVRWFKHYKMGDDTAPPTLRVEYWQRGNGELGVPRKLCAEWVCVEHEEGGFAWRKAIEWWTCHTTARDPTSVDDAIDLLDAGYMVPVEKIEVVKEGKYDRVTKIYHNALPDAGDEDPDAEAPAPPTPQTADDFGEDDLPW